MAWPDDRFDEADAIARRNGLISEEAENVFGSLWAQVKELVEGLKRKPLNLQTNGSPTSRVVKFWDDPSRDIRSQSAKTLTLTLMEDRKGIQVSVLTEVYPLIFDVCDGDVVCLKTVDGKRPTLRALATDALDRLVFPQLPRLPL